jgi:4'-phosphopantetheinyl transferase
VEVENSADFLLESGEIHVRAVWLRADQATVHACRSVLSRDEIDRANRFAFERLSRAYAIAHAGLRHLIAGYLQCPPENVEFTCGVRGKPELRGAHRLRFNMAHSGALALYAFATDCEVGIDVEELRPMPDLESIASRFFSGGEASELLTIEPQARMEAFFRCWTRKEAYIKAVGEGLYMPLDQFRVTLCSSQPARFVHIGSDPAAAEKWRLHHLDPAPNYYGAVAYRGSLREVSECQPQEVGEVFRKRAC